MAHGIFSTAPKPSKAADQKQPAAAGAGADAAGFAAEAIELAEKTAVVGASAGSVAAVMAAGISAAEAHPSAAVALQSRKKSLPAKGSDEYKFFVERGKKLLHEQKAFQLTERTAYSPPKPERSPEWLLSDFYSVLNCEAGHFVLGSYLITLDQIKHEFYPNKPLEKMSAKEREEETKRQRMPFHSDNSRRYSQSRTDALKQLLSPNGMRALWDGLITAEQAAWLNPEWLQDAFNRTVFSAWQEQWFTIEDIHRDGWGFYTIAKNNGYGLAALKKLRFEKLADAYEFFKHTDKPGESISKIVHSAEWFAEECYTLDEFASVYDALEEKPDGDAFWEGKYNVRIGDNNTIEPLLKKFGLSLPVSYSKDEKAIAELKAATKELLGYERQINSITHVFSFLPDFSDQTKVEKFFTDIDNTVKTIQEAWKFINESSPALLKKYPERAHHHACRVESLKEAILRAINHLLEYVVKPLKENTAIAERLNNKIKPVMDLIPRPTPPAIPDAKEAVHVKSAADDKRDLNKENPLDWRLSADQVSRRIEIHYNYNNNYDKDGDTILHRMVKRADHRTWRAIESLSDKPQFVKLLTISDKNGDTIMDIIDKEAALAPAGFCGHLKNNIEKLWQENKPAVSAQTPLTLEAELAGPYYENTEEDKRGIEWMQALGFTFSAINQLIDRNPFIHLRLLAAVEKFQEHPNDVKIFDLKALFALHMEDVTSQNSAHRAVPQADSLLIKFITELYNNPTRLFDKALRLNNAKLNLFNECLFPPLVKPLDELVLGYIANKNDRFRMAGDPAIAACTAANLTEMFYDQTNSNLSTAGACAEAAAQPHPGAAVSAASVAAAVAMAAAKAAKTPAPVPPVPPATAAGAAAAAAPAHHPSFSG